MRPIDYAEKLGVKKQTIYAQMKNKQVVFKKILGYNYIFLKETATLKKTLSKHGV